MASQSANLQDIFFLQTLLSLLFRRLMIINAIVITSQSLQQSIDLPGLFINLLDNETENIDLPSHNTFNSTLLNLFFVAFLVAAVAFVDGFGHLLPFLFDRAQKFYLQMIVSLIFMQIPAAGFVFLAVRLAFGFVGLVQSHYLLICLYNEVNQRVVLLVERKKIYSSLIFITAKINIFIISLLCFLRFFKRRKNVFRDVGRKFQNFQTTFGCKMQKKEQITCS